MEKLHVNHFWELTQRFIMLIIIWQESPEVNLNILIGFYSVGIFSFGLNTSQETDISLLHLLIKARKFKRNKFATCVI